MLIEVFKNGDQVTAFRYGWSETPKNPPIEKNVYDVEETTVEEINEVLSSGEYKTCKIRPDIKLGKLKLKKL